MTSASKGPTQTHKLCKCFADAHLTFARHRSGRRRRRIIIIIVIVIAAVAARTRRPFHGHARCYETVFFLLLLFAYIHRFFFHRVSFFFFFFLIYFICLYLLFYIYHIILRSDRRLFDADTDRRSVYNNIIHNIILSRRLCNAADGLNAIAVPGSQLQ